MREKGVLDLQLWNITVTPRRPGTCPSAVSNTQEEHTETAPQALRPQQRAPTNRRIIICPQTLPKHWTRVPSAHISVGPGTTFLSSHPGHSSASQLHDSGLYSEAFLAAPSVASVLYTQTSLPKSHPLSSLLSSNTPPASS